MGIHPANTDVPLSVWYRALRSLFMLLRNITHWETLMISIWPSKLQPVLTNVLIAARLSIARLWKQTFPPTLGMPIDILNGHLSMEYLFH